MKSYTDLEQSKKLAEILPLESADMRYDGVMLELRIPKVRYNGLGTPCWSLAALRNLLPVGIKVNENTYLFESHNTFDKCWVYRYYNEDDASYIYYKDTNEIDVCYAMIKKLHTLCLL